MKEGHISFKFKSENKLDTVKFHGESIYIKDLKVLIAEARKLGQINSELIIYDERSNEVYDNDKKISTNSSVIVERRTPDMDPTNLLLDDKMYMNFDFNEERKTNGKCPICNDNFKQPITTACCEKQACKSCYEGQFKYQNGRCFFCGTFPKNNQYFYHSNKNSEGGQYRHMNKFQAYGNNHPLHPPPVPADLADILNTAKYFIIKSGNLDNIDVARKLSIWATTLTNQRKLNEAFATSPNVILIFSVNKSSKFQGFARMESLIMNDQSSHFWKDTENIKLGGSFQIRWLRYSDLSFSKISHLRNRFNNNEPIKKSRDTQEIPLEVGREICSYFENTNSESAMISEKDPYTFDLNEDNALKPIKSNLNPNETSYTKKFNEEDYDDVDRFIEENNLGVKEDYHVIKDEILNQSKEEDPINKSSYEDNNSNLNKKIESEKIVPSSNKDKNDEKDEGQQKNSQMNLNEEKVEKNEDLKNDKNAFLKNPGHMNYFMRNGNYPQNYMYQYYQSMWSTYMNYYGNNPAMRNYYYNYNPTGNANFDPKNEQEEKHSEDSTKRHRRKRNSSSKSRERRKSKERKGNRSKHNNEKSRKKSESKSYSRQKSRSRSKSRHSKKKK